MPISHDDAPTLPVNRMRTRLFALAASLLLVAPALAQDAPPADTAASPTGLRKGRWSLSFAAPGYTGSGERVELGVWEMVGPRTNLGLTLEVNVTGYDRESQDGSGGAADQTDASTSLALGLNARQYVHTRHSVAPFVQGRVFGRGSYARRENSGYEETSRGFGAGVEAAFGAEWFPVRQFSVAGYTGGRMSVSRSEQTLTDPEDKEQSADYHYATFQTFTSALSVQIYF
jgi:hypothetical protein